MRLHTYSHAHRTYLYYLYNSLARYIMMTITMYTQMVLCYAKKNNTTHIYIYIVLRSAHMGAQLFDSRTLDLSSLIIRLRVICAGLYRIALRHRNRTQFIGNSNPRAHDELFMLYSFNNNNNNKRYIHSIVWRYIGGKPVLTILDSLKINSRSKQEVDMVYRCCSNTEYNL